MSQNYNKCGNKNAVRAALMMTATGLVGLTATAAAAQDKELQLEEVVVTAQRREQALQNVPIAVTAITASQLEQRQINDVRVLTNTVPNVFFGSTLSDPSELRLGIRGLSTPSSQLVSDVAVGVYVNGVYLPRTSGANVAMIDMERVEVLRGPQGTLFGRNTIGGALNITTKRPTDQFEGSATVEIGNYDTRNFTGLINVPIVEDKFAARLVYSHVEHSGYGRSATISDLNDLYQDYLRGSLMVRFSPRWNLLVTADIYEARANGQLVKLGYVNPAAPTNAGVPAANGNPTDRLENYIGGDFYVSGQQFNDKVKIQHRSLSSVLTGDLGWATVKSITSYREEDADRPIDFDGTPYTVSEIPRQPLVTDNWSQELQAFGDTLDGRLEWIAGLYYFSEEGNQRTDISVALPARVVSIVDYDAKNTSAAAFAQLTYAITPTFRATAGVRYTKDTRAVVYHDRRANPLTGQETCILPIEIRDPGTLCSASGKIKQDYVPFVVGLDWKPTPNALIYVKYSEGFRSGGFPQQAANLPFLTFLEPEKVKSPEAGVKVDLLNRRLRVNAAVFYGEYKNIQTRVTTVHPITGAALGIQANAGDGRIQGGELEVEALIGALRVNASLGVVDGKYKRGPFVGTPFTNMSNTTYSLAAHYPIELSAGTLTLNADYGWRSRIWHNPPVPGAPQALNDALKGSGYGLLNARASFEFATLPLTVSVWGRNLLDKEYRILTQNLVASTGIIPIYPGDPRTYGLSMSYNF